MKTPQLQALLQRNLQELDMRETFPEPSRRQAINFAVDLWAVDTWVAWRETDSGVGSTSIRVVVHGNCWSIRALLDLDLHCTEVAQLVDFWTSGSLIMIDDQLELARAMRIRVRWPGSWKPRFMGVAPLLLFLSRVTNRDQKKLNPVTGTQ